MADDVTPLLRVHAYFRDVTPEAVAEVVRHGVVAHHPAGAVVHDADVPLPTVGFVLRGRLKAVKVDAGGGESLFKMIERGDQFGMMVGALAEPVPVRLVALEPTTVLNLDYELAMDLTIRHPDLRRAWLKGFAGGMRALHFGAARPRAPTMLALVHHSPATRPHAERLVARLREVGEDLAVFTDSDAWAARGEARVRPLRVDVRDVSPDEIRGQAAELPPGGRVVFDVLAGRDPDAVGRLMRLADRVVFFAPAADAEGLVRRLDALGVAGHGWRDKVRVAWLVPAAAPVRPAAPGLDAVAARDFKVADAPPASPWGRAAAAGLERLVHDLRGVRVGVALGGGAARGMSHLGVLKALEENGVVVDMIAGTSAGAMTGVVYASGLDPGYGAARFAADLRPGWAFRRLPRGNHWYLLYNFRRGRFDPMLRPYLRDWRLEQLPVPCLSVTADLVSGRPVVRDRGDAVHAVLESINLPVLSVPICREGRALIDGGLVNNIPADVLVAHGCTFVIAVSVTAKMEHRFADIHPNAPAPPRRRPTTVQTLLRSLLVQNHSLNAIGVRPADVVIEPDVTGFDLTEFMRAEELAAVGEAAAREQIPTIQRLLARHDPQLFRGFAKPPAPPA